MNNKILVIEDERSVSSCIKKGLEENGYIVTVCSTGLTGWNTAKMQRYDLLLIDRMLPDIDGFEICRRVREKYGFEVPVVMLTALGSTEDIIAGLDAGADDYMTKPYHLRELVARVGALLRRNQPDESHPKIYRIADLEINDDSKNRSPRRAKHTADIQRIPPAALLHNQPKKGSFARADSGKSVGRGVRHGDQHRRRIHKLP